MHVITHAQAPQNITDQTSISSRVCERNAQASDYWTYHEINPNLPEMIQWDMVIYFPSDRLYIHRHTQTHPLVTRVQDQVWYPSH